MSETISHTSNHQIIAIALAGGRSSRMGRDKALLEIDGETMLMRTCKTALQVASAVYVVVHSPEQYQQAFQGCVTESVDIQFSNSQIPNSLIPQFPIPNSQIL